MSNVPTQSRMPPLCAANGNGRLTAVTHNQAIQSSTVNRPLEVSRKLADVPLVALLCLPLSLLPPVALLLQCAANDHGRLTTVVHFKTNQYGDHGHTMKMLPLVWH